MSEPDSVGDLPSREPAHFWLPVGFVLLGVVLGFVTGGSIHDGISAILISSLITFVGGGFFAFAGFRVQKGPGYELTVSPGRVGLTLSAFTLGLCLGLGLGIVLRFRLVAPTIAMNEAKSEPWVSMPDREREDGKRHLMEEAPLLHSNRSSLAQLCKFGMVRVSVEEFEGLQQCHNAFREFVLKVCQQ